MADAWGGSWGNSWGASWGFVGVDFGTDSAADSYAASRRMRSALLKGRDKMPLSPRAKWKFDLLKEDDDLIVKALEQFFNERGDV